MRGVRMIRHFELARHLGPELQGRLLGRRHFGQACEMLADTPSGEIVLIDFEGVEIMTGSWANEMVVPLYEWAADARNDLFPILRNLTNRWDEELQLLANWNQQCYLWAKGSDGHPSQATLIGSLDSPLRRTLDAVVQFTQVTGAELERKFPKEGIGATAWNNRLRDLYTKRLLVRSKQGREQIYSTVVKGIVING